MKCSDVTHQIEDYLAEELETSLTTEISSHVAKCDACRERLYQHKEYLVRMSTFKAPKLDSSRSARILRRAVEQGQKQENLKKQNLSFVHGFIAASIFAIALVAGFTTFRSDAPPPNIVGIYDWEQEISLVINVPKDMNGAQLILDLPADISIQGLEHLARVEWPIDLKKGSNTIVLPINIEPYAEYAESLSLAATIIYNNSKKDFELDINLDLPQNKARGAIFRLATMLHNYV